MKNYLKSAAAMITAAVVCATIVQKSSAATTNVLVGPGGSLTFSPANVSISVNDTIIWNWQGFSHSTTSGTNGFRSGLWDSGVTNAPHFFTNTFASAGTFVFYCSVHFPEGMTGQVLVASVALPPSLAITNPSSGAVFAAPADVSIQANVSNGSGTVTNVQFLVNNSLLVSENSGPFSATANNLSAGAYTLSAIAKANNGLSATNSVGISVVTPVTVLSTNAARPSASDFQFSYSANIGLNYVVQRSGDLSNWVSLATNTAASNPVVFDDSNATNSLDFYRVGRLPNP